MRYPIIIILLSISSYAFSQKVTFTTSPELVRNYLVNSEASEVKLTFSPDGKTMLWGVVGKEDEGHGGWDIWGSTLENGRWSLPASVTFNSDSNDFDPFFAPDGRGVYFFSNRNGGFGGDDIYFVPYDKHTQRYGNATNLGPAINSKGDEWGPVISADGNKLMFCSDGWGGLGKHDIFISERRRDQWAKPKHLGDVINSSLDDFDPVWLSDGKTVLFASERDEMGSVDLYVSYEKKGKYTKPERCPSISSAKNWDFGCTVDYNHPGVLYYSSHHEGNAIGRIDIYRVLYKLDTEK